MDLVSLLHLASLHASGCSIKPQYSCRDHEHALSYAAESFLMLTGELHLYHLGDLTGLSRSLNLYEYLG